MTIPNKSNFKFTELTPITGVKPYVIRYWETEFPEIAPITSDSGHKIYARKDVETILQVKKLLFEDKLSIPEAKIRMAEGSIDLPRTETFPVEARSEGARPLLAEALEMIKVIKAKRDW